MRKGILGERLVPVAMVLVALVIGAGGFNTFRLLTQWKERVVAQHTHDLTKAQEFERLSAANEHTARHMRSYLLVPDEARLVELQAERDDFGARLERMKREDAAPKTLEILGRIERAVAKMRTIADTLIATRKAGAPLIEIQERFEKELRPARAEVDAALDLLRWDMDLLAESSTHRINDLMGHAVQVFKVTLGAGLAALVVLGATLARSAQQRRRAQARAEQSEERFRVTLMSSPATVFSQDHDLRYTWIHNATAPHTDSSVIGKTDFDLLSPEEARRLTEIKRRVLETGISAREEVHVTLTTPQWYDMIVAPRRDEQGRIVGITCAAWNVTERKLAEREQQFLAATSAVLVESIEYDETLERIAHLFVPDLADGCIIYVTSNDSVELVTVAHADPSVGKELREVVERYPVQRGISYGAGKVIMTGQSQLVPRVAATVYESVASDSAHLDAMRRIGVHSFLTVPLRARGEVLGALTLMMTRSARAFGERDLRLAEDLAGRAGIAIANANLYKAAQRATRTRDDVLGIVAHDLRSPLNTIQLSAEILLSQCGDERTSSEHRGALQAIGRNGRRMTRLIEDLLDVKRIEAGPLSIQSEPRSPAALVAEAVESQRPLVSEASLELQTAIEVGLPSVLVDPERTQQVFTNLIGNAMKFTSKGGVITLGAKLENNDEVVFWVRDTGRGVHHEHLPHLFDWYWQAGRVDRRGAGLGLAICKGIIDAHHGKIWVQSEPGVGSTFFFAMPVAPGMSP
jgi:PAS domain S-box-containing protein